MSQAAAMAPSTRDTGARAEAIAARWLSERGLRLLHRGYRWRGGELDLVMREGHTLVVVEVRYRRTAAYGHAEETVDRAKRRKLVNTAAHLLARHPDIEFDDLRFDVVAMEGDLRRPTIRWIAGAFASDSP